MKYNKKLHIPKYNFGGWLKENAASVGTIAGTTIGAVGGTLLLPGLGTAAGAGLGGTVGSLLGGTVGNSIQSNYTENLANKESLIYERNMAERRRGRLNPLTSSQMYGIFKLGGDLGDVPNPIINIEEGELAVQRPQANSRTGKIVKEFKGVNPLTGTEYEPHSENSRKEPVANYVPRTMIKGDLAADYIISKKYAQDYKDATKRKDQFALNSIIRNIDAESELGTDERNKQMKMGGKIPSYDIGGVFPNNIYPNYNSLLPYQSLTGIPGFGAGPYVNPNPNAAAYASIAPNISSNNSTLSNTSNTGVLSDRLNQNALLASVPGLINLSRGLFERPTNINRVNSIYNPYEGSALGRFRGRVSSIPAISELNQQRNTGAQNITRNTNNPSILRSNLQGLYSTSGRQAGNLINQTRQANLGLDAQEGQALMNVGQQRVNSDLQARAMNFQIDDMNRQSRAAKSNLIAGGLADISKQQLQLNQNRDLRDMDAFRLQLLMDTFGTNADLYNQPKYAKYRKLLGI